VVINAKNGQKMPLFCMFKGYSKTYIYKKIQYLPVQIPRIM